MVQGQNFVAAPVKISSDRVKIGDKLYWSHVVTEKQTLYSIGKAYGVSSLDIIDANPNLGLDQRSIRTGDVLLIPWHEIQSQTDSVSVGSATDPFMADSLQPATVVTDTLLPVLPLDSLSFAPEDSSFSLTAIADSTIDGRVSISLLLPFGADSIANPRYMNFYFGALLAARNLAHQGLSIELNVMDTKSEWEWRKAPRLIRRSDVVIGPVGEEDILRALKFLPGGAFLVSPIDPRTENLLKANPVVLAATPSSVQIDDALDWLAGDLVPGDSVLVVSEDSYKLSANSEHILERMARDSVFASRSAHISYGLAADIAVNEEYAHHAHRTGTMRVVAASEHDVFVGDVIRNAALQNYLKNSFVAYGPAKAKTDEIEQMCGAQLHQSLSYYIDYNDPAVISFVSDYRALFNGEPDNFAFHGYDTFRYFALLAYRYGSDWIKGLDTYTMEGLQADFRFSSSNGDSQGRYNTGIRRVVYSLPYNIELFE